LFVKFLIKFVSLYLFLYLFTFIIFPWSKGNLPPNNHNTQIFLSFVENQGLTSDLNCTNIYYKFKNIFNNSPTFLKIGSGDRSSDTIVATSKDDKLTFGCIDDRNYLSNRLFNVGIRRITQYFNQVRKEEINCLYNLHLANIIDKKVEKKCFSRKILYLKTNYPIYKIEFNLIERISRLKLRRIVGLGRGVLKDIYGEKIIVFMD
jgi:hypothetical protein